MIRSLIAVAALAALGSACGGSAGASATLTGTIKGQTFTPKDAESTTGSVTVGSNTINAASIVITDQTGLCADVAASKEPKSSHYLVIVLATLTQTGAIVAASSPGDYVIFNTVGLPSSANFAVMFGQTTDATCSDVIANDAIGVSGTVHLTTASGGVFSGTYDVQLSAVDSNHNPVSGGTNEHVTGTFSTAACSGLGAFIKLQRTLTCF
jgi:hypothetical protein